MTDADLLKNGAKIATIPVKAPRDPNQTVDVEAPPEEAEEVEPPEGRGLDQGAVAHAQEELSDANRTSPAARPVKARRAAPDDDRPLLGPSLVTVPSRLYFSVGVNKSGRRGPGSRRVLVPLLPPPRSPSSLTAEYDEHAVTLAWTPWTDADADQTILPSRPIGGAVPASGYNVYEVAPAPGRTPPEPSPATLAAATLLTKAPLSKTEFADTRMAWGATRCYAVRAVQTAGPLAVESEDPQTTCVTLRDTFPPAIPRGLTAVAGEATISLIWDPNEEPDLDGYIVLRRAAPDAIWTRITPQPIQETTFRDTVAPEAHFWYSVQALDKTGNVSEPAPAVDETAR
jgi:hypothetical protein